jgi:hypothetical protein
LTRLTGKPGRVATVKPRCSPANNAHTKLQKITTENILKENIMKWELSVQLIMCWLVVLIIGTAIFDKPTGKILIGASVAGLVYALVAPWIM